MITQLWVFYFTCKQLPKNIKIETINWDYLQWIPFAIIQSVFVRRGRIFFFSFAEMWSVVQCWWWACWTFLPHESSCTYMRTWRALSNYSEHLTDWTRYINQKADRPGYNSQGSKHLHYMFSYIVIDVVSFFFAFTIVEIKLYAHNKIISEKTSRVQVTGWLPGRNNDF